MQLRSGADSNFREWVMGRNWPRRGHHKLKESSIIYFRKWPSRPEESVISKQQIDRRTFMKIGGTTFAAGLVVPALDAQTESPGATPYPVKWYPFTGHPDSDTCWSLSVGPDGRIYAAACAESVPGGVVKPVRYNEERDDLDYLFNLAEMVDDPGTSGRASQCKIHYSFVPSMHDGVLYMATHLSGPPIDLPRYSPWYSWHDAKRCFRGSALLAFDTRNDRVLWWDTLIPKEGCRCLLHDEERGLLYAISYPRDHFIIYDLHTRKRRDLGTHQFDQSANAVPRQAASCLDQ